MGESVKEGGVAGVEGLHGPAKYNGLAKSGAVLDPQIICKNLGDCLTSHAERHLVWDQRVAGSNPATPTRFPNNRSRHGERYGDETYRHDPPRLRRCLGTVVKSI
jgi:hypothetical protein